MSAPTAARSVPGFVETLAERYDPSVFDPRRRVTRVRLSVAGGGDWDVVIRGETASVERAGGAPDAVLTAEERVWRRLTSDLQGGLAAYRSGRLSIRRNLHVGVGFLAASSGDERPGRLRFRRVATPRAEISMIEAGTGEAVLALHGLGATKGSFLPTVVALSPRFRTIAVDQPGFGDSDKPLGAAYDPRFFAESAVDVLDALELERAHLVGNSLGGRVALEVAMRSPSRVGRLGLLAPSLAWRRTGRALRPLVRLARPKLGLLQLAPRPLVEAAVRGMIPDAGNEWVSAGVDEFLRAYMTPSGRTAFYAAARHVVLDPPHGEQGFWTRLADLQPDPLFVWGRHDRLVPIAFARHVAEVLPGARHLELDCGHVPQIELPEQTHAALADFFAPARRARRAS